jgi:hypothetical protein
MSLRPFERPLTLRGSADQGSPEIIRMCNRPAGRLGVRCECPVRGRNNTRWRQEQHALGEKARAMQGVVLRQSPLPAGPMHILRQIRQQCTSFPESDRLVPGAVGRAEQDHAPDPGRAPEKNSQYCDPRAARSTLSIAEANKTG